MTTEQVKFELAPVYKKLGVTYKQALTVSINSEDDSEHEKGFVTIKKAEDWPSTYQSRVIER